MTKRCRHLGCRLAGIASCECFGSSRAARQPVCVARLDRSDRQISRRDRYGRTDKHRGEPQAQHSGWSAATSEFCFTLARREAPAQIRRALLKVCFPPIATGSRNFRRSESCHNPTLEFKSCQGNE